MQVVSSNSGNFSEERILEFLLIKDKDRPWNILKYQEVI